MIKSISLITLSFLMASCGQHHAVDVKKIDAKVYALTAITYGDATHFRNDKMLDQADQLCPKGFDVISKNIYQTSEISKNSLGCSGQNCVYQMEWRLVCSNKPREPFSIFGKF